MAAAQLTIEVLKSNTGITDKQLNRVIEERHVWQLAAHFSNCDMYLGVPGLGLTESDKVDVTNRASSQGNERGMQLALNKWMRKNPYKTYRSLIKILLELKQGNLATIVCSAAIGKLV